MLLQKDEKLTVLKAEMSLQEAVYREAHRQHKEARASFDRDVLELYKVRLMCVHVSGHVNMVSGHMIFIP